MALHRATNASLADSDATADQFVVLTALAAHGPMTQSQLAERTFSDSNTISAMLRRLQSQGYVTRKRLPSDGRVRMVSLTRRGQRVQSELSDATESLRRQVEDHVDPARLNDLVSCLNGIASLLESQTPTASI